VSGRSGSGVGLVVGWFGFLVEGLKNQRRRTYVLVGPLLHRIRYSFWARSVIWRRVNARSEIWCRANEYRWCRARFRAGRSWDAKFRGAPHCASGLR